MLCVGLGVCLSLMISHVADHSGILREGTFPREMFVCATVDQGLNVVNACKRLRLDTVLCRGQRLNSAVMWALGVNGSAKTGKNHEMKAIVSKCAALVGVFSHSAVNNDALRDIQTELNADRKKEMEDLCLAADCTEMEQAENPEPEVTTESFSEEASTPLNLLRRNDTRCKRSIPQLLVGLLPLGSIAQTSTLSGVDEDFFPSRVGGVLSLPNA